MERRRTVKCMYTGEHIFGSSFSRVALVPLLLFVSQGIKGSFFSSVPFLGAQALFAFREVTSTVENPTASQSALCSYSLKATRPLACVSSRSPDISGIFSEFCLGPCSPSSPSGTSPPGLPVVSSVPVLVPVPCLITTSLRRPYSVFSWRMTPGSAAHPPPAYPVLAIVLSQRLAKSCCASNCSVSPSSSLSLPFSPAPSSSSRVSWSASSPSHPFSYSGSSASPLQSASASREFPSGSRPPLWRLFCEALASRLTKENEKGDSRALDSAISSTLSCPPLRSPRPLYPAFTLRSALATAVSRPWGSPFENRRETGKTSRQTSAVTPSAADEQRRTSNDASDNCIAGGQEDSGETSGSDSGTPREGDEADEATDEASSVEIVHDGEKSRALPYTRKGKKEAARRATGRACQGAETRPNGIPDAEARAAEPVKSLEGVQRDDVGYQPQDQEGEQEEQGQQKTHREDQEKEERGRAHRKVRSGQKKKDGGAREATALRHLQRRFSPGHANYRVQKELQAFLSNPPPNCRVYVHPSNIRIWLIEMTGVKGSPYANETYRLKVVIPPDYPFRPPTCFFLQPAPVHLHVYSNGDICLNLLGSDWRPSLSISAVAVAILSMLTSAKQKQLPTDNAARKLCKEETGTRNRRDMDVPAGHHGTQFLYHDDKV
uniref:Ubiquitin carrier protein, related n=1 Tax=Neospora caninum (strain Liverpool) TaxID=572307 RepID=A0A0F7U567_NEOCL|nr:TPA: Ubiquitin carrier protein, related [Neospora caninum Liverpool]